MHIARLREKLADDPADPQILVTVRGMGYMYANNHVESAVSKTKGEATR